MRMSRSSSSRITSCSLLALHAMDAKAGTGKCVLNDEKALRLTGNSRHHVSVYQGQTPFVCEDIDCLSFMQWAACCGEFPWFERPIVMWTLEDTDLIEELEAKLHAQQERLDEVTYDNWSAAKTPGTDQWHQLRKANEDI